MVNSVFKGKFSTKILRLKTVQMNLIYIYLLLYRIGKAGTLTLERDPQEEALGSVTGKTRGTYTVLELNPLSAKFYIGGIPSEASVSQLLILTHFTPVMNFVFCCFI